LNNGTEDAQDILTAPFHFNLQILMKPQVYFTLLGAGAALGGAFALDSTMRAQMRGMSNSAANGLEDAGTYSLSAAAGLIYLSGLITNDDNARHDMITTGEGVAIASLVTLTFKYTFGRQRPNSGKGVEAWFQGGQSFTSGEATPAFALAAASASITTTLGTSRCLPIPPPWRWDWAGWDTMRTGFPTSWAPD